MKHNAGSSEKVNRKRAKAYNDNFEMSATQGRDVERSTTCECGWTIVRPLGDYRTIPMARRLHDKVCKLKDK